MLSSESSKSYHIWIVVVLLIIALGYIIYVEVKNVVAVSKLNSTDRKSEILEVYGDFFRTPDEQEKYAKKFFSNPNNTMIPRGKNVSNAYHIVCRKPDLDAPTNFFNERDDASRPRTLERRSRRYYIENSRYHGCCISRRKFVTPDWAISDHNGHILNLVHFDTDRQYFLSQDCWHDMSCTLNCGCRQQMGLFQALVHNPAHNPNSNSNHPRKVVRMIQIPGSCKCMNNLPPP